MVHEKSIGVQEIKDNTVILKDGSMVAVLEVIPIAFEKLNEHKQKKITQAYRAWLEQLDYPVQIVARTVNYDVQDHIKVLKNQIEFSIKLKEEYRDILKQYKDFEEWLDQYIAAHAQPRTVYYLVIPYFPAGKQRRFFKNGKAKEAYGKGSSIVHARVAKSMALLAQTGVQLHRLDDAQLANLYNSYFRVCNHVGLGESTTYITSGTWFNLWKKNG